MCINHCCLKTWMPKEVLNRPNILSVFQQMSGKAMPQRVNRDPFGNFRLSCSPFDLFLEIAWINMVSSDNSCSWVQGNLNWRKYPEPDPLFPCIRQLPLQCIRQLNTFNITLPVFFVNYTNSIQMFTEIFFDAFRFEELVGSWKTYKAVWLLKPAWPANRHGALLKT